MAIWVWPKLSIPPVHVINIQGVIQENTQTLYLLSAIAQSLAAIAALVFTLSLITFQLSSKYSQRLISQFFNKFTIIYIIIFVISIFLPLWTIAEPSYYIVKLSLSLAAVCLFLLIPYFLDLRERLSPEKMLWDLYKKSLKIIHNKPNEPPSELVTLDNFIMSAYSLRDYETCRKGVDILAILAYEADKSEQSDTDNIDFFPVVYIYDRLNDIAISTIDDPRVPDQIINAIWRNAFRAIEEDLGDISNVAESRLSAIALESAERGKDNPTHKIIGYISSIAQNALIRNTFCEFLDRRMSLAESCIYDIIMLSKETTKRALPDSIESAVKFFANVAEDSLERGNKEITEKCLNELFKIIGEIPFGLFKERIGKIVCQRLFELGALFMGYKHEENQRAIIKQLNNLKIQLGYSFVKSAIDEIPKYRSEKWEEQIIKFKQIYEESS